ncbi:16S rRNA (guanine(527)-N(7))-methyltransferase RsmG [Thermosipho atlanticus]|uniref:Ribosomal RNA small subunit methyltransferase G n=1 Tax=Thermosipho atlanticus DSM 15807 TaxID=1123380 RepID=A0A1M5QSJ2_9BACT|nr:16S rRNA (guanine(527)-N(7))-methyltransferase RsmG [Thermosipho atlanticus]SHH16750.1 16S rRNA m(7)G-527 methyltransferase [Thermosipho atlanticus DSM 15807]
MTKDEIIKNYVLEIINAPFNLTAFKDFELAYNFLAIDSLKPLKKEEIGENFLDVGTGGGVPGVFINIFYDVEGTLIDSSLKKINYVKTICEKLGLNKLKFVHGRIEEQSTFKEKFDSVFSRAVAELRVVLELTVPFAKKHGKIFLYKGINYKQELENAKKAIEILKLKLIDIREYNILEKKRYLLVFEKQDITPPKYPRRYSKISKFPL